MSDGASSGVAVGAQLSASHTPNAQPVALSSSPSLARQVLAAVLATGAAVAVVLLVERLVLGPVPKAGSK